MLPERSDALDLGSATVSVALAGVPPAIRRCLDQSPIDGVSPGIDVFGGTPKTADETTALPKANESLAKWRVSSGDGFASGAGPSNG